MSRAAWLAEDKALDGLAALATEVQAAGLTPTHRLLLGQIAEIRGAWADAETWYRSVPPGMEGDRARLRIGATLEQQGKFDAGIAWWRSLETDPGVASAAAREAFLQDAQAWARHEQPVEAQAAFDRGLARFADDAVLLYARAMEHIRRDRVDAALADLKRIIDRNAEHADALNAYGYTLAEFRARYAEALPFVEKSNRLQPHSSATLDSLGWIRLKLGQPAEALALLREAWALGEDPEIAAHLGEALWLGGDHAEARRIWTRGAELDPNNRVLRATRSRYDP
jgi:tetratricopeptide (TPR) repeat protein